MTLATPLDARIRLIGHGEPADQAPLTAIDAGSKATNLQRLHAIGLRVPPAFVVTTGSCRAYMASGQQIAPELSRQIQLATETLEAAAGRRFGGRLPLLVSVRSSPPVSMPGMLDTVLNVGLTEQTVHGLVRVTGNPWLAWDAYRRFARGYAETVMGCPPAPFDHLASAHVEEAGGRSLQDLDPLSMRALARATAALARALSGSPIPSDAGVQLEAAIAAVFRSWTAPRAREYRRLTGVSDDTGTAVVVQSMVFGNGGGLSGSGVGFTRDPSTGADELYVDFLFNAQGEDVVSGRSAVTGGSGLARLLPAVHAELLEAKQQLERAFGDMHDIEFTVEDGRLYFLQTRTGKRTPWAALRIAVDLVRAGLTSPRAALETLAPYNLSSIARVRLQADRSNTVLGAGLGAGLGVASGAAVFDADRARVRAADGPVILVRQDIATDDVAGIAASAGVLTAVGGRTSHAAVVARHLGKVCVVGCGDLRVEPMPRRARLGGHILHEGDPITLDGESGRVYAGVVPVTVERPDAALAEIASWRFASPATGA